MRDVAKECYEKCKVGTTSWMQPDLSHGETLDGFQSVLFAAQLMEKTEKLIF